MILSFLIYFTNEKIVLESRMDISTIAIVVINFLGRSIKIPAKVKTKGKSLRLKW
jgi:hypothetical protein